MAMHNLAPKHSKAALARELGVARSSLYYQPQLPAKDQRLKSAIEKVLREHKAYGHKRIAWDLGVNKKRVLRVMKLFGLKPHRVRQRPDKANDQGQTPMPIPNLLLEAVIDRPRQAWVSDFTYLPYQGKFVYLATVEDRFTRQVMGWSVSVRHTTRLVAQALLNALEKYAGPKIFHSDQGSEYRSQEFLELLEQSGIKPSMSAKGSPWQNGYQESFYSQFKLEIGHPDAYPTLGELVEAIAVQIIYYNTRRIHTALKCPPFIFAQRYQTHQLIQVTSNAQPV